MAKSSFVAPYCNSCALAGMFDVYHPAYKCPLKNKSKVHNSLLDQMHLSSRVETATRIYEMVQAQFEDLWLRRHDYPVWPEHDDPLDAFEREIHEPARRIYYNQFKFLIDVMRLYRNARKAL